MEEELNEQENRVLETEKRQISILRSGNINAILNTLTEIRKHGRLTILPEIFDLMLASGNIDVIRSCSSLICDIKSEEAVPILIDALEDKKYYLIRNLLLAACWQNGLDYHDHVQVIAKIFLQDDYPTAIEAFTLIENCISELDDKEIVKLISFLNAGFAKTDDQKKILLKELLTVIKS